MQDMVCIRVCFEFIPLSHYFIFLQHYSLHKNGILSFFKMYFDILLK